MSITTTVKLRGGGSKFSTKKRIPNLTGYEKKNNNWPALLPPFK